MKNDFLEQFTKAEKKGLDEIKYVFQDLFKKYKVDYKLLTELVVVLDLKNWEHKQEKNSYSRLYNRLYENANDYAVQHLKDIELDYYFDNIE